MLESQFEKLERRLARWHATWDHWHAVWNINAFIGKGARNEKLAFIGTLTRRYDGTSTMLARKHVGTSTTLARKHVGM